MKLILGDVSVECGMNTIKFAGKMKDCNGMRYYWMAHTKESHPKTIYINKHKVWLTKDKKYLEHLINIVMGHEPIHPIIWRLKLSGKSNYDLARYRFLRKLTTKQRRELKEIM